MHDLSVVNLVNKVEATMDFFLDFEVCYKSEADIEDIEEAVSRRIFLRDAIVEAENRIREIKVSSLDFRVTHGRLRSILKPVVDLKISMENEITIATSYLRKNRVIHGAPGKGSRRSRNVTYCRR